MKVPLVMRFLILIKGKNHVMYQVSKAGFTLMNSIEHMSFSELLKLIRRKIRLTRLMRIISKTEHFYQI